MRLQFLTIFFIIISTAIIGCSVNPDKRPRAVNGVINLKSWNMKNKGPIDLSGEWNFYPNRFINQEELSQGIPDSERIVIRVPDIWNKYSFRGKILKSHGYGTYHLKILNKKTEESLALQLRDIGTAYSLYIDGQLINRGGKTGKTADTSIAGYNLNISDFCTNKDEIDIIFHVSNFDHRNGGLWEPVRFGRESDLRLNNERKISFDLFVFGSIIIMGIYHFGLFAFNKRDKSPLYFGFVCMLFALRILVTGEYYLIRFIPEIPWKLVLKVEYLSFYLGVIFFITFLYSLFRLKFSRKILRAFQITCGTICAVVLFTGPAIYSYTVQPYEVLTVMACLYSVYVILISFRENRNEAVAFLPGFLLLFALAVNDILHHNLVITTGYLVPFGLYLFIFFQAFLLAFRFSWAIKEHNEAKFKLLQERINPHFLFNALNTIHALIYKNNPLADEAVLKLANNYRYLMDHSLKTMITFEEEWQFIKNYLELEELRFRDILSFEMNREGDFSDIKIPPLTLQPIVENSFKHGLKPKAEKGHISVFAERKGNGVKIVVKDNGVGLHSKNIYSRSLGNILNRLEYQFDKAALIAKNRKKGGVQITISFNIKKKREKQKK